jgi:hypothetical protein
METQMTVRKFSDRFEVVLVFGADRIEVITCSSEENANALNKLPRFYDAHCKSLAPTLGERSDLEAAIQALSAEGFTSNYISRMLRYRRSLLEA